MKHDGLKSGILITWTKSFACPDGVGEDAVKMLEDAITRRGVMTIATGCIKGSLCWEWGGSMPGRGKGSGGRRLCTIAIARIIIFCSCT